MELKMAEYDYDLFVIGAGSGGVRASRMSASFGARVGIAEEYRFGGTCVIRGCVPKKLMVYASHFAEEFEDAGGFGWTVGESSFSWPALIAAKDKEIDRLEGIYHNILGNAGVEMHKGRATIVDAHTLDVAGKTVTADTILVATGGKPTLPDVPGIEHAITSNEIFHLPDLPKRAAVVGGGYIAIEFAGILNGLGAETTLFYRGEQILRGFDDDVRNHLAKEVVKKGLNLRTGTNVTSIEKTATGLTLTLTDGTTTEVDAVLYGTGRHANVDGLGLEAVGVERNAWGGVVVDEFSQTTVPNIYAIGDVTNRVELTPVALMEGMALARTLYAGEPTSPDHKDVPHAVFSQPSCAIVGMTEAEALAHYGELDLYKSTFRALKHTLSGNDEQTFMKLIVDQASQKVVGVHMVGADAAEIIQGVAIAVKMGATKQQFDATLGIHPTSAEEFVTMRDKWTPPQAEAAE
jgi:glutathione reductase (NADPH)